MPDLDDWLSLGTLADHAGRTVFQRGEAYFRAGSVSRLRDTGGKVTARVRGTEPYQVKLWTDGQEFFYDCTCPHAREGNFCKHCVAVGLAFLDARECGHEPTGSDADWDAIRRYLPTLPPQTLADWLLEAAQRDDRLYRRLLLQAQQAGGAVDWVKTFRREIDAATRVRGYFNYEQTAGLAEQLDELVDALEELQTPACAAPLAGLAEYAIEKIAAAAEQAEDAGDKLYAVLQRLQGIHYAACETAQPDPEALAERLFKLEVAQRLEVFYDSLKQYEGLLGRDGTRRFGELAEMAWRELPPPNPKAGRDGSLEERRGHLSEIMQNAAERVF